jgi:hypothetical protein
MTGPNSNQLARELSRKEWRTPFLRKLPIAATAHSGKTPGAGDDGTSSKNGDIRNLS